MDVPHFGPGVEVKSLGGIYQAMPVTGQLAVRCEYLWKVLQDGAWYVLGPANDPKFIFQLIWRISPQLKTVGDPLQEARALEAGVVFHELRHFDVRVDETYLQVYPLSDSVQRVDLVKLCPFGTWRLGCSKWQAGASRIAGCVELGGNTCVEYTLGPDGLCHPDVPTAVLLFELVRLGWKPASPAQPAEVLTAPGPGRIRSEKAFSKPYLQALLHWDSLWDRGLRRLPHNLSARYYSLILRAKKPAEIPSAASKKHYDQMLTDAKLLGPLPEPGHRRADGDDHDSLSPSWVCSSRSAGSECPSPSGSAARSSAAPAAKRPRAAASPSSGASASPSPSPSRSSSLSSAPSARASSSSAATASTDGDAPSDSDDVVAEQGGAGAGIRMPRGDLAVGDLRIRYDAYVHRTMPSRSHARYWVQCPVHPNCRKHRGCGTRQTLALGEREPHAFLMAWVEAAGRFETRRQHVAHRPSGADVARAHRRHFGEVGLAAPGAR